jgi:protease-4
MASFFKTLFGSCLGTLLGGFLLAVVGFSILAGMAVSLWQKTQAEQVVKAPKENTVLELNLGFDIPQYMSQDPMDRIDLNTFELKKVMGLDSLLLSIDRASRDDRIKGIHLNLSGYDSNWSTTWEIRNALQKFKDQEKWVLCYGENFSQRQYYLASVSDYLYLHPQGGIELVGLSLTSTFFGRLIEKLDIDVEMFRGSNNVYKSAVEPFTRENFSEENRQQMKEIVEGLWTVISKEMVDSRGLAPQRFNQIVKMMGPRDAKACLSANLIDRLLTDEEVEEEIDEEINQALTIPKRMSILKYASHQKLYPAILTDKKKRSIALIHADGPIQMSQGDDRIIRAEVLNKWIKEAVEDEMVAGIVLRVNSPGGGAFASELIYQEIKKAQEIKPVIVSFGDMAASGGYYLSCSANQIVSAPTTLTGSIGVFGLMPSLGKFLEKHVHVTYDGVKTHEFADAMNGLRPLTEAEKKIIQVRIDDIYKLFKNRVKEARRFDEKSVDEVARGRVWYGLDAVKNKLVDRVGGLMTALEILSEQLQLNTPGMNLKVWPRTMQWDEWMKEFNFETTIYEKLMPISGEVRDAVQQYNLLENEEQFQARIPFILDIQ